MLTNKCCQETYKFKYIMLPYYEKCSRKYVEFKCNVCHNIIAKNNTNPPYINTSNVSVSYKSKKPRRFYSEDEEKIYPEKS